MQHDPCRVTIITGWFPWKVWWELGRTPGWWRPGVLERLRLHYPMLDLCEAVLSGREDLIPDLVEAMEWDPINLTETVRFQSRPHSGVFYIVEPDGPLHHDHSYTVWAKTPDGHLWVGSQATLDRAIELAAMSQAHLVAGSLPLTG